MGKRNFTIRSKRDFENRIRVVVRTLGALGLIAFASSCGSSSSTTPTAGTFTSVYSIISGQNCQQCHTTGTGDNQDGAALDFTTQAKAYSSMIGAVVAGSATKTKCPSVSIVSSGSVANSYLLGTMFWSTYGNTSNFAGVSGCTPYEHSSTFFISSTNQASVVSWITNGLPNN